MGWELDELVKEHDRTLRAFVRSRAGGWVADDIVGDVWIAAVEARRKGRELTPGWLYAVARNKIVDHWRRSERGTAAMVTLASSAEVVVDVTEPTTMDLALERLPSRHRRLLEGHYVDGWPMQDLADREGSTYRAAESALARARTALRARVEELQVA